MQLLTKIIKRLEEFTFNSGTKVIADSLTGIPGAVGHIQNTIWDKMNIDFSLNKTNVILLPKSQYAGRSPSNKTPKLSIVSTGQEIKDALDAASPGLFYDTRNGNLYFPAADNDYPLMKIKNAPEISESNIVFTDKIFRDSP